MFQSKMLMVEFYAKKLPNGGPRNSAISAKL